MLRRLVRDPWAYLWSALLIGGGAFLAITLAGCSGMEVSYKSGSIDPGAVVKGLKVAGDVANAAGFPWLGAAISTAASLIGGLGVTQRVVTAKIAAHDAAPFTPEDAASLEAAKAGQSKPVA